MEDERPKRARKPVVRFVDQIEECMRIQTDIAASFVIVLVEHNLTFFLSLVNKDLKLFGGENEIKFSEVPGNNVVVYNTEDDGCPWCFYDPAGNRHDPYELGMQEEGSDQFACIHALRLAHCFWQGDAVQETDPEHAYLELIKFWNKFIVGRLTEIQAAIHLPGILESVIAFNIEEEPNKEFVQQAVNELPKPWREIIALLNTEYAKLYAPTWD
jgi:hypothetical protein